ncbi:MAG: hypothetical protein HYX83_01615 [Chloroflexi bacterium]|nr:hypothetical protein [Chloroflexota bacterium]
MVSGTSVDGGESLQSLRRALEEKRPRIQVGVFLWASSNLPRFPWRQPGRTPYEVLIGEFWLKESNPGVAISLYERFLERFFCIRALAEASQADIQAVLTSFKLEEHASGIKTLAVSLLKEGKKDLPDDAEIFLKSSGLGRNIIQAIMCFSYNLPVAVLDVNTVRMLSRIFIAVLPSRPSLGLIQAIAQNLLPERNPQDFNSGLLDMAELICCNEGSQCRQCYVIEACDHALSFSS